MTDFPSHNISLADGTRLILVGTDEQAADLLALFSAAARLELGNGSEQRIIVSTDDDTLLVETVDGFVYRFKPVQNGMVNPLYLYGLSHVIALQTHSGILLHGALAEHKNRGVILIARGGTGKTTASNRLPSPWHSLSDDLTLVIRDGHGKYWAHPWPTWSCFYEGREGGNWDVQRAVPLRAIYQLSQADKDWAEPLGTGESIILLIHSAEQAFLPVKRFFDANNTRLLRVQRFEQLSALKRSVMVSRLYLSLHGSFWQVLEDALEM